MADFDCVHLRRGQAGREQLTEALDRLGVSDGEDFVVARAADVDEAFGHSENLEGPSGATHPQTSRDAAFEHYPRSGTQRHRTLVAVADGVLVNRGGRTADEVELEMRLPPQSATPRLWELRRGGWVQRTGVRRKTQHGSEAAVYEPTPKAWDALGEEEGIVPPRPALFPGAVS